jgi:hypothetical protein
MGYDFLAKEMYRAGVVAIHLRKPNLPILYLDGEDGEATYSFLNVWKILPEHLVPVNYDELVIQNIQNKHPGVLGKIGDINDILTHLSDDTFSVVWLDYTCRYNSDVHTRVFSDALRISSHVSVTFSIRGVSRELMFDDIMRVVKRNGKVLESITPYKGKSYVENMIKFTVERKDDMDNSTDCGLSSCSSIDETHLFNEIGINVGDRVFVYYRRVYLTAIVLDCNLEKILVKFDYDAMERWVGRDTVSLNKEDIDLNDLKDSEIGAPMKIFTNGMQGYDMTKRTKKCLLFRIGKRYRCTRRLTVHAVMKNGVPHKKAERWTITPEQALCWKRM